MELTNDNDNISALAYFLQDMGLYHEAIDLYDRIKETDPLDLIALAGRAETNAFLSKWEMSINDYEDLILLEPKFVGPYLRKLGILLAMGKIDEAQDVLKKCREIDSESDYGYWEGLIYASKNDKESALKINKDNGWYYALLGMKEEYIILELKYLNRRSNDNASGYLRIINEKYYNCRLTSLLT